MQIDDYWDLVSLIDTEALLRSDGIAALQPLLDELERHTKESVFAFYKHMVKRLYALNRDDVRNNCEFGHSGEGFLYHRLFVIGRGREYYSAFLEQPQYLSEEHCSIPCFTACQDLMNFVRKTTLEPTILNRQSKRTRSVAPEALRPFVPASEFALQIAIKSNQNHLGCIEYINQQ